MRIMICCSKRFYDQVDAVRVVLEKAGHEIILPNSYEDPGKEESMRVLGAGQHNAWKATMLKLQGEKIAKSDAIVVLNLQKDEQLNYIGGATFLEIFKAFELGKIIFLWNEVPQSIFTDELLGMSPHVICGDLGRITLTDTLKEDGCIGLCSDCGNEAKVMFRHWGFLVPKGIMGTFCPGCWVDRQVHFSHFRNSEPLGIKLKR